MKCECGCGQEARKRFVSGHNSRPRVLTDSDFFVEDRGFSSPCWIWTHGLSGGYGKVTVRKRKTWAHKAMWEQINGPVPSGLELDHLCRVPSCICPNHLEPVTHRENIRRGKGIRVTTEVLGEILRLRNIGLSHRKIAQELGIGKTTVGYILNGQHLP